MINFILGSVIGCFIGVILICLVIGGNHDD
jgi:hypothetical protein